MSTTSTTSAPRLLPRLRSRIASQERGWYLVAFVSALIVFASVIALVWFVLHAAWPALTFNGLKLFSRGSTNLDNQLGYAFNGYHRQPYYHLNALDGVAGTLLISFGALVIGVPF